MSILVNKHTRVITQGVNGQAGRFHTAACRQYGHGRKCFVGAVDAAKSGRIVDGMPIFGSVGEAKAETNATASVIYLPPGLAEKAVEEAVAAELDLVVCVTDGFQHADVERLRHRMHDSRTLLLGPNCTGVITPDELKLGILPGEAHRRGRIGIVSRSRTLTCEVAAQLASFGLGESTVVGIGHDPLGGVACIEVLRRFNDDPGTDAVLLIGEIAGNVEETCARWVADHMRKPVVGFIAGAADSSKQSGISAVSASDPAARRKLAVMDECGITVTRNRAVLGELLASVVAPQWLPFD